jgi:hypothetical protein
MAPSRPYRPRRLRNLPRRQRVRPDRQRAAVPRRPRCLCRRWRQLHRHRQLVSGRAPSLRDDHRTWLAARGNRDRIVLATKLGGGQDRSACAPRRSSARRTRRSSAGRPIASTSATRTSMTPRRRSRCPCAPSTRSSRRAGWRHIGATNYRPDRLTGKYRPGGDGVDSQRRGRARVSRARRGGVLDALDEVAAAHETTVAAVALAWLRAHPRVAAPIASARTTERLEQIMPRCRTAADAALERMSGTAPAA